MNSIIPVRFDILQAINAEIEECAVYLPCDVAGICTLQRCLLSSLLVAATAAHTPLTSPGSLPSPQAARRSADAATTSTFANNGIRSSASNTPACGHIPALQTRQNGRLPGKLSRIFWRECFLPRARAPLREIARVFWWTAFSTSAERWCPPLLATTPRCQRYRPH